MNGSDFSELNRILEHRSKARVLYWVSAISFWLGVAMVTKYLFEPDVNVPSYIPGLLMGSGVNLYCLVRYLVK